VPLTERAAVSSAVRLRAIAKRRKRGDDEQAHPIAALRSSQLAHPEEAPQ